MKVSDDERAWLRRGLTRPDGKLPLFDLEGQSIPKRMIASCADLGLIVAWQTYPHWTVYRLTDRGRAAAEEHVLGDAA